MLFSFIGKKISCYVFGEIVNRSWAIFEFLKPNSTLYLLIVEACTLHGN